jgi:hypothetical protein
LEFVFDDEFIATAREVHNFVVFGMKLDDIDSFLGFDTFDVFKDIAFDFEFFYGIEDEIVKLQSADLVGFHICGKEGEGVSGCGD